MPRDKGEKMKEKDVLKQIDNILNLRIYPAIKKMSFNTAKERLKKTSDFKNMSSKEQHERLANYYSEYYKSRETFYLSLYSLYALYPLYQRELKIEEFEAGEIYRIKADYSVNGVEFSANYPAAFSANLQQEMNDCIVELKNKKNNHIVDNFTPIKDAPKPPPHPLTNGELKFSGFYLLGFEMQYTVDLAKMLFNANLITDISSQGWFIDDLYAEEMISILNQKFGEERVLQYKRRFHDEKIDRTQQAIVPINLSKKYFPLYVKDTKEFQSIDFPNKNIAEDALRLYEFIFYITLSTQMKDSIYDRSKLKIRVGNKTLLQESNVIIEGEENWEEIAGKLIRRLKENSQNGNDEITVLLPELKVGDILNPIDIYSYKFKQKRPPRYGIGRFFIQILEKNDIAKNELQEELLEDMIKSKAIRVVEKIIYPQESLMVLMEWLEKYIPSFVELEFFYELREKIASVCNGDFTLESLLNEINDLVDVGLRASGYQLEDDIPSEQKIKLVKTIALKNGVSINEDILSSNAKCDLFLSKFPEAEEIKVGKCPSCNGTVFQKEWTNEQGTTFVYFACENFNSKAGNRCNFSLWDTHIYKFFSVRAMEFHVVEHRRDALQKVLSKKTGYLFNEFKTKDGKTYPGIVFPEVYYNEKKSKQEWKLSIKFPRKSNSKG